MIERFRAWNAAPMPRWVGGAAFTAIMLPTLVVVMITQWI